MRPKSIRRGETGFALVLVLWVLLVLAMIANTMLIDARTTRALAASGKEQLRIRLLLDGAINRAIVSLLDSGGPLRFSLEGRPTVMRILDKDVSLTLESESGKVDLNASPPSLLAALFQSVGISAVDADRIAAEIVAWRTPLPTAAQSEAIQRYRDFGLTYGPRFHAFRSVGELRLVLGMTDDLQGKVERILTIWSAKGSIDRSVASDEMLTMLATTGDKLAESQKRARHEGKGASSDRFAALGEVVTISAGLEGALFNTRRIASVQVGGDPRQPIRVLAWR